MPLVAPWKEGRQTHADARLSIQSKLGDFLNEHCLTKRLFWGTDLDVLQQPASCHRRAQLERSVAERLFHLHKVSQCHLNSFHDRNEGLEWFNCNKHFLNVSSAPFLCTHRATRFSVCLTGDRIVRGDPKFRRRSSPPPQRCGSQARLLPWCLPVDR